MLTPDDFYFYPKAAIEDIIRYSPGGYHRIILGDILNDEYRVIQKSGFGENATTWFTQKTDNSKSFVAVKVTTAERDIFNSFFDHFSLNGPNGTHSVLVTDVVVPTISILSSDTSQWRKIAAYGLAKAVVALHSRGIIHAVLRLDNVGLAIPQLAAQDPWDAMQDISLNGLTVAYVVTSCKLAEYYDNIAGKSRPQTKVLDLSNAHKVGTSSRPFRCASVYASECIFARVTDKIDNPPIEPPADVWALGAAIFPFHGVDMKDLPHYMVAMAESLFKMEKLV
ncbi:hypothetical protein M422DRAFT_53022 [Sphaerobolus stellatus SS14]|uniref:non-specific serine/threonine protein kinase n=1 Tax=Sphaerobolus stellatus (strain SS14) TaxID=990650 RepID=A0A0C9V3X8_SPHS4|nr:hypothetical protein M422DRAFT_53022 [Sphaerobolus stellatus SS14]